MNVKYYIEEALMNAIEEKPIDKIFANDIINKVGVCKKTFYKYYCDKYDLLTICFNKRFYDKISDKADLPSFLRAYADEVIKMRKKILNAFCSTDINSLGTYNVKFISDYILNNCLCAGDERNRLLTEAYGELITILTIRWLKWGKGHSNNSQSEGIEFAAFLTDSMPQALKKALNDAVRKQIVPNGREIMNRVAFA